MTEILVGGITPLTSIDYPGELATVIYCQGCPWRCNYCHNQELLPRRTENQVPWSDVLSLLKRRRGLVDAVVFSGGEPTLQRSLGSAIKDIKRMGFKIGLHTAGCYPSRLARILPDLDWVGLDIKSLLPDYEEITGIPNAGKQAWDSLQLVLDSGVDYEVRTTVPPGYERKEIDQLTDQLATTGVRHFRLQECNFTDRGGTAYPVAEMPGSLTGLAGKFETFSIRQQ